MMDVFTLVQIDVDGILEHEEERGLAIWDDGSYYALETLLSPFIGHKITLRISSEDDDIISQKEMM